ncbi:hypothetical protein E8E13_004144 [Curvularia kusanoi]|uniref:Beta-lactamase-related domain-containing protein n=1 Tax=Curvularia kusanoi TaxID=90978 RepID=A0A9P4WD98_CURKU|nr:hypothetical protein E8E13_004144 [Curvularia kusanoi]
MPYSGPTKIDEAFIAGNTTHGPVNPNDTYSIQIFSTSSEDFLVDYHHRGSDLLGNRTVDGDSIYRIASTSKLITMYLILLQSGEAIFGEKVTKYVPELSGVAYWDEITVRSLAGFLGDVVAEVLDVSSIVDIGDLFPGAFPPLAANETSGCNYAKGCNRETFLQNLVNRRVPYLPNSTPSYSNAAYAVLGLIVEAVTNSTFKEALDDLIGSPLNLTRTTISAPEDLTNAVIPGNATTSGWDMILNETHTAGMGGLFTTPNELSKIGVAILSSSLIPASTTRAWMKPTSFTSSLVGAVGPGFEIYRAVVNAKHNRVVDLYTKAGNLPGYGAALLLIPDFDVGIVLMQAGKTSTAGSSILGTVLDDLLPALDEAARVQADAAFAGTYVASNGLNSTVKLISTPGIPGISLVEWVSNGTDLRLDYMQDPEWVQMYPTNILSKDGKQFSWRSSDFTIPDTGSPLDACPSWGAIDRPTYGIYGLDEFVFHLGDDGKAWGLEPKALKIVLEKV